jgi:hypothetical protein
MKTLHLSVVSLILIIFLGFGLTPAHADDANGISIQSMAVQPSMVKVGNTFTVSATLVNNSTVPIVLEGGTCVPLIEHVPFFTIMFDNHTKIKTKNLTCAGVGWSQILDPGKKNTSTSPDSTATYIATESGTANVTVTFQYYVKNQDLTQPNIEQTISKSFQFLIHDINETYAQKPPAYFASPLQQIKAGVSAQNVKCGVNFSLVIKSEDGSPACVKPDTAQILVERGWGTRMINVQNTDFSFNYSITGGSVEEAKADMQSRALVISIKAEANGMLLVDLPRGLIDPKMNNQDSQFVIYEDGHEAKYDEKKTTDTNRVLSIPFANNTSQIEIISPEPIP